MTSAVGMFCSSRDTTWGSGFGGTAAPWAGLACACMKAEKVLIMLKGTGDQRQNSHKNKHNISEIGML